jgi:hypothetical protein
MRDAAARAGTAAAALWLLLCVRWFDAAAAWRPAALAAIPPAVLLVAFLAALGLWLRGRLALLRGAPLGDAAHGLVLVLALAFFFRLPVVIGGAAAAVTADGALSGIVALHLLDGSERLVFVPQVPYSGSLKSHLTALLALALEPARAFALASVLFYLAHVAGVMRLALLVSSPPAAVAAGLYAAFSPAFVTRYSLSNDGNYVELLALGTWALWLGARAVLEPEPRGRLALAAGLLLGLGFWCHILAVIHVAALALLLVAALRLAAVAPLASLGMGVALGYVPGWLWNLANGWGSLLYLVPGQARSAGHEQAAAGLSTGLGEKLRLMLTDHAPVLLGYDTGYGPLVDRALLALAWAGVAAASLAFVHAALRAVRERSWALAALLLFAVVNVAVALLALPHVPGNPRYAAGRRGAGRARRAATAGARVARDPDRHRRARLLRPGAPDARPGRALALVRGRARGRRHPSLLHGLLSRDARELPLLGARRVQRQARAVHHRVLLRLSRGGRARARRRARAGQPHGRAPHRAAPRRARRRLRATRSAEAGAVPPVAQGGPRGALPRPLLPDALISLIRLFCLTKSGAPPNLRELRRTPCLSGPEQNVDRETS